MTRTIALIAALALSGPALARSQDKPAEPEKPIIDRAVTAGDVVTTPVSDLNLKKDEIPALLVAAQERPYDLSGLRRCTQIASAIGDLDAVLGDDIDVAQAREQGVSAGRLAQSAVGSFIPFRGLIREISGANAQERKVEAAVYAGSVRRAFLKGVGQQRGCAYPARAATAAVIARREASVQAAAEPARPTPPKARRDAGARFVAKPVVQKTPR